MGMTAPARPEVHRFGHARPVRAVSLALACVIVSVFGRGVMAQNAPEPPPPLTLPTDPNNPRANKPQRIKPARPEASAVSPEIAEARTLINDRKWSEAGELIASQLEKRPRDPQWRFLQGVLFAETGKRVESISVFERLTDDFPELAEPYNNLASLYVEQNELHKARLLLERAIQNRPDYAMAHENLADVYIRLAITSYRNASNASQPSPSVELKLDYLLKTPAIRSSRITTRR